MILSRFPRIVIPLFLFFVFFISGCATTHPHHVKTEPPASVGESGEEQPQIAQPPATESSEMEPASLVGDLLSPDASPAGEEEKMMMPFGAVFAKTVFEGVVKTSYVQLTIVDVTDPQKVFQLIIGDKARQKNLPWNIQTVKPGYFFINLPVGHYRINSITIPVGTTLATEPMDVSFDVELDKTIYLGTLRVIGEKERIKLGGVPIIKPGFEYTLQILDERTEAQKEFSLRFPEHGGRIDYQLMEVNAFNNNRLTAPEGDS